MQKEIEQLRRNYRKGRQSLFRHVAWGAPSLDLLGSHSSLVDDILKDIYTISCQIADAKAPRDSNSGLSIVATGGYGRRELNPYSDIDIAFIPSEEDDPWVESVVHTAFKLVMDVFLSLRTVRVGYAFRPVSDASTWDLPTKTALLDSRHICGESTLSNVLSHRVREVLSPLDIVLETTSLDDPLQKQLFTDYLVEPNLKDGPGSLRDLHRGRWIFKLFLGVEDGALDSALQYRTGIRERQIGELHEAADWFWKARTWLHLKSGKLSDVLITNYQDPIARELNNCTAQEWLSKHLSYAETLARFRESAVRTLLQGPFNVDGIRLEGGTLHVQDAISDADYEVRLFRAAQRYSIPISLLESRRLDHARNQPQDILKPSIEEVWAFNEILNEDRNIAPTLRVLARFGIMDRFIPNFSETMRFVPPDPVHRYTVGEHSFRIIEHLENLRAGRDPGGPRFTDLLHQCPHFDILCLAALLHDAGKLLPGDDHCEKSAELAKTVSESLRLAPEKSAILDIIIRQHLLLMRTVRLLDLKSSNVLQRVADRVPDIEALRYLYVFTYVDTCAVRDKYWTSMDYRDLEDLYRKMQVFYESSSDDATGKLEHEDKVGLVRKKLAALRAFKKDSAALKHCDEMPSGYILNTALDEIAFHLQLIKGLEKENVVLDIYNRPGDDYSTLTVCTHDDPRPGMLAKITGVLYGCDVDIQKAQAFTTTREKPVVLDTLWIRSHGLQVAEKKARRIQEILKEVLSGTKTIDQFLADTVKAAPEKIIVDGIDLRNDLSEEHTVVHILARDLQGLLYIMTRSLSRCGLHIHSAKIWTRNGLAENNFYVTTLAGGQIPAGDMQAWRKQLTSVLQGVTESDSSK
jgi:[protein-PII] uridylyltransferase